jgi:hypothetical protein
MLDLAARIIGTSQGLHRRFARCEWLTFETLIRLWHSAFTNYRASKTLVGEFELGIYRVHKKAKLKLNVSVEGGLATRGRGGENEEKGPSNAACGWPRPVTEAEEDPWQGCQFPLHARRVRCWVRAIHY